MPEHSPGSFEQPPSSREHGTVSSEHAIMQEITAPLATLPDDPVPVVADVDFPVVLRGYDRIAVDAYVRKTAQLVAELQATRSPEAAVRRALERVGEEVSGILQRAHETAERITAKSRADAEDRLDVARQEAAALTAAAERRVKELDTETDRIWAERHRIVEDARLLASELTSLADSASARFPAEEPAPEEPPAVFGEPSEAFGEPPEAFGEPREDSAGSPAAFGVPFGAQDAEAGFGTGLTEEHGGVGEDFGEAPTEIAPAGAADEARTEITPRGPAEGGADEESPEGYEHGPEAPGDPR